MSIPLELDAVTALQAENSALRAELSRARWQIGMEYLEQVPAQILVLRGFDMVAEYANAVYRAFMGERVAMLGRPIAEVYPEAVTQGFIELLHGVYTTGKPFFGPEMMVQVPDKDGSIETRYYSALYQPLIEEGTIQGVLYYGSDVTTQVKARQAAEEREAERSLLQEQVIQAQEAALRELSTPLIPIADGVVVMPLVGSVDTLRAQQIMETLLSGVAEHHAQYAILDITGVKTVDTHVADALVRAALAAKLLGTQVILSGISAEVAKALVHLGVELSGITCHNDLQSGIAYTFERSGKAVGSRSATDPRLRIFR
jgi:rsbT co-antagonist protein RsbR